MGTPSHKAHDRLKAEDNNRKISTASSGSGTETAFERIATDAQAELKTDDFWDGRDTPSPNKLISEDQARKNEEIRLAALAKEKEEEKARANAEAEAEANRLKIAEEAKRAREEAERKEREEAERREREEKERLAREEAERITREEERIAREEKERI